MPDYSWPTADHRTLIGKRISRVDSPFKVSGRAKYTYDYHAPQMLFGKVVRSPYAKAKIVSIDTSAAQKMPGVRAVEIIQKPGSTVQWAGDEVVAVAAVDEGKAEDAARAIVIKYQPLHFMVSDAEPPAGAAEAANGPLSGDDIDDAINNQLPDAQFVQALQQRGVSFHVEEDDLKEWKGDGASEEVIEAIRKAPYHEVKGGGGHSAYQKAAAQTVGDPDKAFSEAGVTSEGLYGAAVITHCCLESHGSVAEWPAKDHLFMHISTQNVSGIPAQMADPLEIPAANIRVHQDNMGGGFGSKFAADRWDVTAARLSKKTGLPVRIMLERQPELEVAGARPSAYARVKVAATKDGELTAWQSQSWGTGGPGGGGMPPIPYVFNIAHQRKEHTAIRNNIGPARAWRAPNHPQAAVITMCALDDLAAKLNMDPLDFWLKNLKLTGAREATYREELPIAADLMGWKDKWRGRGQNISGNLARGVGLSIHTWGGRGHASDCDCTIHPDGSVDVKLGSQDLGTGTRTTIVIVAAETLGLPVEAINLFIGDTMYPPSGPSGGSSTPGGVSSSTRRAAVDARQALFEKVAPALNAQPDDLECANGTVRVKADPGRSLSWKDACAKLGALPVTARGKNPDRTKPPDLSNSGVGGVGMADVEVDLDTGIVKVKKMVAVQDCGLIIDLKMAESSCFGAMIMGIGYALYEEKIMDQTTGRMLNPNMEFYRLAGLNDIPELVVHMMTGKGYDKRGVIGLGEPPVISPGAAISNAVTNAIGVRVPFLPMTPDKVLAALEQKAGA